MTTTSLFHPRSMKSQAGMTLIEVILALGILVTLSLAFLHSAMNTMRMNKMTELSVAGTNTITGQLDSVIAASRDNSTLGHGGAKGVVFFLKELHDEVGSLSNYPIKVELNSGRGILIYEFPIPTPGYALGGVTGSTHTVTENQYELGRGVMVVYLKESSVPKVFYEWNDLEAGGSGDVATPNNYSFFDMDSDGKNTSDFTNLFTGGNADFVSTKLDCLPVTLAVRYYSKIGDLEDDKDSSSPGFKENSDRSLVSVERNYVINNTAVIHF